MKLLARILTSQHPKQAIVTSLIYSLLFLLPSCRIPCPRDAEPGPSLPESFSGRVTLENSTQLTVTEFFNDPVLTNLIDQALVGNQQLKILSEDIQIANNEVLSRKGAYFPFFNFGLGAGLNKYSGYTLAGADNSQNLTPYHGHFPSPLPDFMIGTEVSWQVDIWRKLRNARDAAALRYLGTTEGRNYVVTRLVADVAQNYYKLMALDNRIENLDSIIKLQEDSLTIAKSLKDAARVTELPVQRFVAELRKNNSEKLIIQQEIIETENAINFLVGRYPMPVERRASKFIDLQMTAINVGLPSQLLQNRPDIRQAELEMAASGLDVKVARARFYPQLTITGGVGVEAFNPRYLFFTPESLIGGVAGGLVTPVINRAAIKADYLSANARQLQAVINYQRVVLNAFTEVINRFSMVENYGKSIEIKQQQLKALEASVDVASRLFQNARAEYLDVLFAQRDLLDARMVLIETKRQQVTAVVNTYQALGGGGGGLLPVFDQETVFVSPDPNSIDPAGITTIPPEPQPETPPQPVP